MKDAPANIDLELQQWLTEQEDASALTGVSDRLRAFGADKTLAPGFNRRVVARAFPTPLPARRRRQFIPLAAAACLLLSGASIGFFLGQPTPPGQLAWGDITSAMQPVKQFHVSVFRKSLDTPETLEHFDLYYQGPKLWRAQGGHHIQFGTGATSRLYDISEGKFVKADKTFPGFIPSSFADGVERDGVLDALVKTMFRLDQPPAKVLVNDAALRQAGVQVFDYGSKTNGGFVARIWVLEQSKLPIRLQVEDADGPSVWANVDYSDSPHDANFFDPDFFEEKVQAGGPPTTREAFENRFSADDVMAWYKLALQWREPAEVLKYSENPADPVEPGLSHRHFVYDGKEINGYSHNRSAADNLPAYRSSGEKVLFYEDILFIHERTTASADHTKHLVAISSPSFQRKALSLNAWQIGSNGMPLGSHMYYVDMTDICGPGEIRLFAGQPDERDPSRFSIPFEANGKKGWIDGQFVYKDPKDVEPVFEFSVRINDR